MVDHDPDCPGRHAYESGGGMTAAERLADDLIEAGQAAYNSGAPERLMSYAAAFLAMREALQTILLGCPPEADDPATEHGADHELARAALAQADALLGEEK